MKYSGRRTLFAIGSAVLAAAWLIAVNTVQAASPGAAVVKKVVGTATYTDARGGGAIKENDILFQGATITTGAGSYVDLDLGVNGNALRVEADSTLALNKLEYTKAIVSVVDTQLEVKKGSTVANVVNKLSKASKYEIKTPAGVAGIRGTALRATTSRIVCLIGTVQFRTVNGQLQLVLGGTVYAAGTPAPVKSTRIEASGVAASATACTVNTSSAATVNQVVKQFTTVIAGAAALEAGVGGAADAAADAAKAVMAQLLVAVKEAADSAPLAIRAQAQAAAAQLAASADAITAASAGNGAALGTIAAGGTSDQAKANGNAAVDGSGASDSVKGNVKADLSKVIAAAGPGGSNPGSSSPQDIINPGDKGPAATPVAPDGKQAPAAPVAGTPPPTGATTGQQGGTVPGGTVQVYVSPTRGEVRNP